MLLKSYTKEIFRPECNPSFESLHCIAHLDQDISEALPYLNAELGGFEYLKNLQSHFDSLGIHDPEISQLLEEAEAYCAASA